MTAYDIDTIEDWRRGFTRHREVYGVQPDIWQRVEYLKERGYRRFQHIQAVLGRRASKGVIGGVLGCEQMAFLHSLDNPQAVYGIAEGKDVYMNVGATSQTVAMRQQFADIRTMIERCKYFRPSNAPSWIAESKDAILRVRTGADVRRIAEMKAAKVPIDHQIATLVGVALSASSVAGRGPTSHCLDPETPVLTADLRWVPIRAVLPGDEVVGVDEFLPKKADGRPAARKLHKATVLARSFTIKKAYRLTFDDGRSVVCSADHRWLLRRNKGHPGGPMDWRVTRGPTEFHSLKVGDQIVQLVEPWEEDDSREAGYLAGVYDGEGCLYSGSGLAVLFSQNPGIVLDYTLDLLKDKGFHPQPNNSHSYLAAGTTKCHQWAIRGVAEGLRFLGQIRPERLVAHASASYDGVALRGKGSTRYQQPLHMATITNIEELPEKLLVDIQTSTKTFIANGFVSHNCNVFDEFAYHVQTGSVKSDSEIYSSWQPSLGQFGIDALTYIPSSPWTKVGQFFTLYEQGKILMSTYHDDTGMRQEAQQQLVNAGHVVEFDAEPAWLIFQGPSWGLYENWQDAPKILGLGYKFDKPPEPDLTDERQIRERRRDPQKFSVEKQGQFSEVIGAYLDPDAVDRMFDPLAWREPLESQSHGIFSRKYRIHCDPGRTGANFALAIGHIEDAPPDEQGHVWPHVICDLLHVWRPMDYPEDSETHKQTIDYVQVHSDIEDILSRFMSTEKISFDQWNSASFLSSLKQKFSPGIRVVESTFTEKANQARCEKFKSAINLGWCHAMRDNFYVDNLSCLLELELKFLAEKNGKVIKQDVGPVVTKDLADAWMVVVVDLLHDALDRYSADVMTAGAHGSTWVAGLKSGWEQERQAEGMALRNGHKAVDVLNTAKRDRARNRLQGRGRVGYKPDRLSSIHMREPKLPK